MSLTIIDKYRNHYVIDKCTGDFKFPVFITFRTRWFASGGWELQLAGRAQVCECQLSGPCLLWDEMLLVCLICMKFSSDQI